MNSQKKYHNQKNLTEDNKFGVLLERQKNYAQLKAQLIKNAKEELGDDIFENYYLPLNFNYDNVSKDIFYKHRFHTHALPFSNEQIKNFITMPKVAINNTVYFNSKGKNIHGVYLMGVENGKPILFALQIVRSCEYQDMFNSFSIKLDVCIQGKVWFSLLRLDVGGKVHFNYLKNGVPKTSFNDNLDNAPCPHLHENSEECQVYFYDNLSYTTAKTLNFEYNPNVSSKNNDLFKKCLDFFLDYSNTKIKLNNKLLNNYHFNEKMQLFDKNTIKIKNNDDVRSL